MSFPEDFLPQQLDPDKIKALFLYEPSNPLLFNSGLFLVLFCAFLGIYGIIRNNLLLRVLYVTLFSFYFYYKSSGWYILLMMLTSLAGYISAPYLYAGRKKAYRKFLLIANITFFLGLLAYFKYSNFFIEILNNFSHQKISPLDLFLPLGISFYTFELISYVADVYLRKFKPVKNLLDFSFYISFFPHLVAGPIVRPQDLFPQIRSKLLSEKNYTGLGIAFIAAGLLKKAVISDYIGVNFVDRIFDNPALYSGVENLLGVYGYTLQIYCDFSGYSDMAVGIAYLMGYELPLNFNAPYLAKNITDFWRRWHISLSSWLRDYLYVPLGGNRKGKFRTYLHLFITMLLGGLWHGASWKFVIWGGLHGVALAVHKFLFDKKDPRKTSVWLSVLNTCITFHFVAFCWIFFRAADFETALTVIKTIGTHFEGQLILPVIHAYPFVFLLMALGYVLHLIPLKAEQLLKSYFRKTPVVMQALWLSMVIWLVYQTRSAEIQPFIYFQF